MPKKIHIVMGDNAEEYEDHRDWEVAAYENPDEAERHAELARSAIKRLGGLRKPSETFHHPYDKNIVTKKTMYFTFGIDVYSTPEDYFLATQTR